MTFLRPSPKTGGSSQTVGEAAVVASTPIAAQIGAEILRKGGNASDAAVAACLALCVSDPANLSIAGRCHAIVAVPNGDVEVIDGATQIPRQLPQLGPIPIPGLPAALSLLHERHGKLAQARLMEPAVRLAVDGFEVSNELARVWQRREPELALNASVRNFYLPGGHAPSSGQRFRHPELGEFLKDLQTHGLNRFYHHVDIIQDGPWQAGELRAYEALIGPATRLDLDDGELVTTGKQAWGPILAHLLDMLLNMHEERDILLHVDHIARCCATALRGLVQEDASLNADLDTTHLVVVDREGMVISLTGSIGPHFGAKKAHPTLGFLYPWSYQMVSGAAPLVRDVTEMCPSIVMRDGRPWLAIGAAGSERIPQAVAQALRYRIQDGLDLAEAVSAPRLAAVGSRVRLWHESDPALLTRLSRLGWQAERAGPGHVDHVGIVHAAEILPDGRVIGAADSAYDGTVVTV